jgi:23S rRNA (uracil1939-C5)-methyltransferase
VPRCEASHDPASSDGHGSVCTRGRVVERGAPGYALGVGDAPERDVEIEHVVPTGEGVGHAEGRAVHVVGAFGGEHARVRIVHRSRQQPRDVGTLVRLERPHPDRRPAPCARHERRGGRCGGCPLMELGEPAQRAQKRAMLAALGLEVDDVVQAGPSLGYRFSSKRVAFDDRGQLALGSWARGSHVGADMAGCLVDHPRLTDAADELAREARALGVRPFDEASGEGDLRYAWLKTDGERVLLTLVTARDESRAARALPERLRVPHAVAWGVQPARGNAIRGSAPQTLRGPTSLTMALAGVTVDVGPLGFLQPNPTVIARAYRDLVHLASGAPATGALAFDLYAGAGITTALLRRAFARVVPCESYPESAAALGVEPRTAEAFLADASARPDLVVANPPRKGLGPDVCRALAELAPPRIHVMSCGPEGLARDLAALEAGGYRRTSLIAYDALPQTPHVELVVRLERAVGPRPVEDARSWGGSAGAEEP